MSIFRPCLFLYGLALCALAGVADRAVAQSSCSSDGQRAPVALVERFIRADCAACWSDPKMPKQRQRDLVVDWIVPSAKGEDAPLSAGANRDASERLGYLDTIAGPANAPVKNQLSGFESSRHVRHQIAAQPAKLRVARGLAFGGYMGASIELALPAGHKPPHAQTFTAWLLLVETIPQGADGTPVSRNLVRNSLMFTWNMREQLLKKERSNLANRLRESRPLSIPAGANPDRLQVIGWVEDAAGRVIAGAQSACVP